MKTGVCGLCKKTGIIKKSHLLPKSSYKQVRDPLAEGGGSPMRIDTEGNRFGKTDKQVNAHFLCGACEGLFSRLGETGVSKVWATHFAFPMLEILSRLDPASQNEKRSVYALKEFPADIRNSLFYFAISVVWRASMWPRSNAGVSSCKNIFTPQQLITVEEYLLSGTGSVDNIFVVLDVNRCTEMSGLLSMPARTVSHDVTAIQFDVLGLRFITFIGDRFPREIEDLQSIYDRNFVITSSDHSEGRFAAQLARYLHDYDVS